VHHNHILNLAQTLLKVRQNLKQKPALHCIVRRAVRQHLRH
jgi:hypothetical protein